MISSLINVVLATINIDSVLDTRILHNNHKIAKAINNHELQQLLKRLQECTIRVGNNAIELVSIYIVFWTLWLNDRHNSNIWWAFL